MFLDNIIKRASRIYRRYGTGKATIGTYICNRCKTIRYTLRGPYDLQGFCNSGCSRQTGNIFKCKICTRTFYRSKYASEKFNNQCCSVKCRTKFWVRENHPSWKGGTYTRDGYKKIYDSSRRKYRFEHRIVMQKLLGRRLRKHESVHHKNGIRDDNRPENLELWTIRQVPGKRISDLISFVTKYYPAETRKALSTPYTSRLLL